MVVEMKFSPKKSAFARFLSRLSFEMALITRGIPGRLFSETSTLLDRGGKVIPGSVMED